MMPLDTVANNGKLNETAVRSFGILKNAGVYGVMVDVWWGICEPSPKRYNFGGYQRLADLCQQAGLKLQCVMSFHQCGGNVGDNVYIPIPEWVRNVNDIWYRDVHGHDDKEVVGLFVDNDPVLQGRTPVQVYTDYMNAFKQSMGNRIGTVINEIQVGLGPCGELRYPGYQSDRWSFPGVGEFQAFAPKMKQMFQNASKAANHPEWDSPPTDAGSYNSRPDDTSFFRANSGGYQTEYGKFFMNWYSNLLIEHARKILTPAVSIFRSSNCAVAMKVAGIHWWYGHASHASEMTTGYVNGNGISGSDFYKRVASLLRELGVIFDFTCFEMSNNEQPSDSRCQPEDLVNQVIQATRQSGVTMSSENALERYDSTAYNRVIQNTCNKGGKVEAFTYLRLNDKLVYNQNNLNEFKRLVSSIANC